MMLKGYSKLNFFSSASVPLSDCMTLVLFSLKTSSVSHEKQDKASLDWFCGYRHIVGTQLIHAERVTKLWMAVPPRIALYSGCMLIYLFF